MQDTEPDEAPSLLDRLRQLPFGSAAALFCVSVALLFASIDEVSFFVKPLGGVALLLGLAAGVLPAVRRREGVVLPLVIAGLCLVVVLFVGSWPGPAESPSAPTMAVSLTQKGMAANQPTAEDAWTNAAVSAVQKDDIRVQVVSAKIGRVEMKGRSGNVSSSDRHLIIRLRVSHQGVLFQPIPYESWAERAGAPSKCPPVLTDNKDRTYNQKVFDAGWKVIGRAGSEELTPGHQVKEVLAYPVPPADVEYYRLVLPGAAFGQAGEFRFQIPRSMFQAP